MRGIKRFLTLLLFGMLALAIVACGNTPLEETPTGDNVGSFGTYDNLKEYLSQYFDESNDGYYRTGDVWLEAEFANDALDGAPVAAGDNAQEEKDYSKTNNQVEGVMESDRILTDGYKIYIVSGNQFFIVDADTLNIDYTFQFIEDNTDIYSYGYLDDMYLYDNKIILTSYVYSYYEVVNEDCDITTSGAFPGDNEETDETVIADEDLDYYYNPCVYYEYTYGTKVIVLDVEDSTDVTISRELYFDSAYLVNTRMIDEQMYLILDNYMIRYGFTEEFFVPRYSDSAGSGELENLDADRIFFMPSNTESFGYLVLASFDVTSDDEVNVKAYLGNTWQMYMSLNNLYTIINKWTYNEGTLRYDYFTYIVRFEIEDDELVYKATGQIEGNPLNQFSMDEYDGVFRIATTGYSYLESETDFWSWEIDNYLFCLDATSDGEMTRLSMLTGLGKPGEKIYAVRFAEEIGYVVTFEQIDPLYKLDLSDPEDPIVVGELEEEGVSDYLHIINDNLMLGIGREADNTGEWTRFTGVKVALYDTTGDNPEQIGYYKVDGEYSYTNVMWDHKAFVYFTPEGQDFTYVAIPVYEYFEDYWGYSQSLYVFKVNHEGSLEFLTNLTHLNQEDNSYSYYDSIERAVMIENYIYTVSYSQIKMFDINSDFAEVNSQTLNPDYYNIWGYPVTTDEEVNTAD